MYSKGTRDAALRLLAAGRSINATSTLLGVSRSAIREWRDNGIEPRSQADCPLKRLHTDVIECIRGVHPGGRVFRVPAEGCVHVQSNWKHWPCLFPQHGPGKKHERALVLEQWQRDVVEEHPVEFLRGLFHSDGCRFINWTVRGDKRYQYGRWMFSNNSTDIMRWCQGALDLLGVAWTMPRGNCLSVATRAGVAYLDDVIGPKA